MGLEAELVVSSEKYAPKVIPEDLLPIDTAPEETSHSGPISAVVKKAKVWFASPGRFLLWRKGAGKVLSVPVAGADAWINGDGAAEQTDWTTTCKDEFQSTEGHGDSGMVLAALLATGNIS